MKKHIMFKGKGLGGKYICNYCGRDNVPAHAISHDHFVPKSKGGKNGKYNLVDACDECNQAKGNLVFTTFEEAKKYILEKRKLFTPHCVKTDDFCYFCTVCKEAHGDGDGFIGKPCWKATLSPLLK